MCVNISLLNKGLCFKEIRFLFLCAETAILLHRGFAEIRISSQGFHRYLRSKNTAFGNSGIVHVCIADCRRRWTVIFVHRLPDEMCGALWPRGDSRNEPMWGLWLFGGY